MSVASSILLILSLALGIMFGPQLRPWSWGPAMVALALALITGAPALLRKKIALTDVSMIALGVVVAGWFAIRAWVSPVPELARADLLLLASIIAAFLCVRAIEGHRTAEATLIGGVSLLLLTSIVVAGMQLIDPTFSPIFSRRIVSLPTGFFAHYNEGANFVLGTTLLVAGAALFGNFPRWCRVLLAVLTILGIVAVYYFRSRGGLLGLALGSAVFAIVAVWTAKRQKRSWFAPAVVALPIIGLAVLGFLFMSWNNAQAARGFSSEQQLLDNDIRLYLAGIAISCIGLHPWAGGGSRSFGWECYRFWENTIQGQGTAKPEFIHNEFLQVITDYGIIGGTVLLVWAMLTIMISLIRLSQPLKAPSNAIAWQVGGVACLTGIFVQSNFSFVFHMMPLAVLLGICLGLTSRSSPSSPVQPALRSISQLLLGATVSLAVLGLLNYGIKGTRVSLILWPSMFSKQPKDSLSERLEALTAAIAIWPLSAFYIDRAQAFRESANHAKDDWFRTHEIQAAVADYAAAQALDPFEPNIVINQANLLSALSQDSEAEIAFAKTLAFQGGMENAFQGHFHFAQHLYLKGVRQYRAGELHEALGTMESAAEQIKKSYAITPWNRLDLVIEICSSLGAAREAVQDQIGALQAYDFTCTIPGGHIAHFRAAWLLRKMGADAWEKRRPSDALAYFIEAKRRATISGNIPADFSSQQRAELINYLETKIKFLENTQITPTQGLLK